MTTLPTLRWLVSANQSERHGATPYLVVVHRPAGSYEGAITTLRDPAAEVSAHVLTEHDRATQLVPWSRKAWACRAFNAVSYNVEVDDDAWNGGDAIAYTKAARVVAYICHKTGIPARWSRRPTHDAGVCRHYDLGVAGGGHTDPTTDDRRWREFVAVVAGELARGGFRRSYGRGTFERLT